MRQLKWGKIASAARSESKSRFHCPTPSWYLLPLIPGQALSAKWSFVGYLVYNHRQTHHRCDKLLPSRLQWSHINPSLLLAISRFPGVIIPPLASPLQLLVGHVFHDNVGIAAHAHSLAGALLLQHLLHKNYQVTQILCKARRLGVNPFSECIKLLSPLPTVISPRSPGRTSGFFNDVEHIFYREVSIFSLVYRVAGSPRQSILYLYIRWILM